VLDVQVQVNKDKVAKAYIYKGGLFKVWIKLEEGVQEPGSIRWKTGKGDIAIRNSDSLNGLIIADTVYLHWESLPKATMVLDTHTVKASSSSGSGSSSASTSGSKDITVVDTTYRYLDTIAVVVDGKESSIDVIEIMNILPRIDSLWVGGIAQPGDSILTLAVHPGERIDVSFRYTDAFNTEYPVQAIEWPAGMGTLQVKTQSDSIWTWTWSAPNGLLDTILPLILTDKGGFGTREYRLQLIVYDEAGSAWVVSGEELVKFSPKGSEVARVWGPFDEVSDIVLNSNSTIQNKVWVLDIGSSSIYQYDAYGRLLWKDSSTFQTPYSLAIDVESRLIWVSDMKAITNDTLYSRVRRFSMNNLDSGFTAIGTSYDIPGPVKGLSIDQFERNLVWFVSPEQDYVGFIRNGEAKARIFQGAAYNFNRPSVVSYDPVTGYAWIADSSRVVVVDTSGDVKANITGFEFANSLSSGGGVCWVSDILAGSVYKFLRTTVGSRKVSDGLAVNGFISPASVSTYAVDQGVWVADKGAGEVVRLSSDGTRMGSGSGLTLPTLVRVHQVIE
jgi:hypothetical protein